MHINVYIYNAELPHTNFVHNKKSQGKKCPNASVGQVPNRSYINLKEGKITVQSIMKS